MAEARPTIAHVLHWLKLAGAEVLAADLARRLGAGEAARYRFVFLCLDEVGPLGEQLSDEGFVVEHLRRKPGIDMAVAGGIRDAVSRHGVDLLHAHQYTPFFYAAASRRWRAMPPVLFTEHGRHYPDHRSAKRVIANRLLLRRRDRVTAVGEFVKRALVANEGIKAKRIEVIHNGIDPQRFAVEGQAEARARVRRELGLGDDQPVALQVARFHPVKDHATAVRAMAHVVQSLPGAVLLLAGEGDDRAKIESLAAELGVTDSVRFLGLRRDVPDLMAAADVFVLSSLSEGISVTLLEAMGCARAIAATDVGGNGEVVAHEQTGLLSPRRDDVALGENLLRLLRDAELRTSMGRAGRERLLEKFTQQRMHDAYAALYQRMLAPTPRGEGSGEGGQ